MVAQMVAKWDRERVERLEYDEVEQTVVWLVSYLAASKDIHVD